MRVLLPVRPDNDCSEPARILEELFGHEDVSILRIFVYRPAELDVYDPEMLAAVPAIRRLDDDALKKVVASTKAHCRKLIEFGFHVESAIVSGFPVEAIVEEARSWKADLIVLHVTREKLHEARIGRIVGTLIDSSPVPLLIYPKLPAAIGKHVGVVGANARPWAERLAARQHGEIHDVREDDLTRELTGERCDLLVMAAHHHFAPAILGSAERRIVRNSDIPVLLIPS